MNTDNSLINIRLNTKDLQQKKQTKSLGIAPIMQIQLPTICISFLNAIQEDLPVVKLYKYRNFITTFGQTAMPLFNQMTQYALDKKLLGEYELLHTTIKKELVRTEQYNQQRQEMVEWINAARGQTEHAQSIGNVQDMVNGYYKLAEYYRKLGSHQQAISFYSKLFRAQSNKKTIIPRSQYFSQWAQEFYFVNNWTELSIFIRNDIQDPKLVDSTLATLRDLKAIEMDTANKFFDDLLSGNHSVNAIISNQVISYVDLGILYSLVALAKKDREFLKVKTLWSAKLEVLFLQNNFRELLSKIHKINETQGKFHPLIDKLYNKLLHTIRERILVKYLSVFTSVSIKQVEQQTTITEGELISFLKRNPQLPYLIDPITRSIIYYEKQLPLYDEVIDYSRLVKERFNDLIRKCINSKKLEQLQIGKEGQGWKLGRGPRRAMDQMDEDF